MLVRRSSMFQAARLPGAHVFSIQAHFRSHLMHLLMHLSTIPFRHILTPFSVSPVKRNNYDLI